LPKNSVCQALFFGATRSAFWGYSYVLISIIKWAKVGGKWVDQPTKFGSKVEVEVKLNCNLKEITII